MTAAATWTAYNDWNRRDERMAALWVRPLVEFLRGRPALIRGGVLLDYGCGYFDAGLAVTGLARRADGFDLDTQALRAAAARAPQTSRFYESETTIPREAYDVVVLNSVIQYFGTEQRLTEVLRTLRTLLHSEAPDAEVILADLVPQDYSAARDALRSVWHAGTNGCLKPMLVHLYKAATKPDGLDLLRVDPARLARLAEAAGFRVERLATNLTPSRQRYSMVLRPRLG